MKQYAVTHFTDTLMSNPICMSLGTFYQTHKVFVERSQQQLPLSTLSSGELWISIPLQIRSHVSQFVRRWKRQLKNVIRNRRETMVLLLARKFNEMQLNFAKAQWLFLSSFFFFSQEIFNLNSANCIQITWNCNEKFLQSISSRPFSFFNIS